MSKPIARVAVFVLISLVLIAASSASVRGWLGGASERASVQSHTVSGLQTNLNHDRSSVSELQSIQLQMQSELNQAGQGHDCHSEQRTAPQD